MSIVCPSPPNPILYPLVISLVGEAQWSWTTRPGTTGAGPSGPRDASGAAGIPGVGALVGPGPGGAGQPGSRGSGDTQPTGPG